MKRISYTLISLIVFTLSAFAESASESIVCGNGTIAVEALTSGKPHYTINYKNLYHAFSLFFEDSHVESISENEETGEIIARVKTGKSILTQKIIPSRNDDAVIISLIAESAPFTQKIRFSAASNKKTGLSARTQIKAEDSNVQIHAAFSKPITDNDEFYYGYESVVSAYTDNGKISATGEELALNKCNTAILFISLKQLPTLAKSLFGDLRQTNNELAEISQANKKKPDCAEAYSIMLNRHMEKFTAACKEVSLSINSGNSIDSEIADLYNNLYFKSIRSGEGIAAIETDNFSALPKLNNLIKNQIKSSFLFDYYLYTLNTEFLQEKVLPLMLTTYESLEKTLKTTDDFGFYIIAKDDPAFEVAVSISFLRDFITTCNILMAHQDKVPRLQEILAMLPPYKIDINEEFRRHLYGESTNENKYADVPQLYGLFYRNDPIITRNYDIREACKSTIQTCIGFRKDNNVNEIDKGFLQLALSSAALGDGNTSYKLITDARSQWNKAGSRELVPIIKKMLVQSYYSPESSRCYLNLLPAIPDHWTNCSLASMPVRGGITLKELVWNDNNEITATIESKTDISVDVYIRGHFVKSINLTTNEPYSLHAKKRDDSN